MGGGEAGRELNAQVAQVIFGHAVKLVTDEELASSEGQCLQDVEQRYSWRYEVEGEMVGGWGHLLPYSTSMDAAWLVAERMADRYPDIMIEGVGCGVVDVTLNPSHFDDKRTSVTATGKTPAEAICRAALRASR